MTCILGVEDPTNGRAIVFSDSGCWRGYSRTAAEPRKIWRSGEWIASCAGAFGSICLARSIPIPPVDSGDAESTLFDWAQAFQKRLAEFEGALMGSDKDHTGDTPAFIVARGSSVWGVDRCAVTRYEPGFQAAGCREFLTAAMCALASVGGLSQFEMGKRSLELAAKHTDWAVEPFRWMATDGTEGVL